MSTDHSNQDDYPAGTVRTMYVHCTYSWYNVRTMYVHCTYSARWVYPRPNSPKCSNRNYRDWCSNRNYRDWCCTKKVDYSNIDDDEGFEFVDAMGMSVDIGKEPGDLASVVHTIEVNREMILKDLIMGFKKVNIDKDIVQLKVVLPNRGTELAEDSGGATRNVLTEAWEAFYEQNTVGTKYKIPFLGHGYGEHNWASVTKVFFFYFSAFS